MIKSISTTLLRSMRLFVIAHAPYTTFSTLKILLGISRSSDYRPTVMTFSVSEDFARLWFYFIKKNMDLKKWNCLIVDCAGNFNHAHFNGATVLPFLNLRHGQKIDILLKKYIKSNIVFLCDDDQYLISNPSNILNNMDESIAAISLCHREKFFLKIKNKKHWPMGTYALVFLKDILLKNNLKFQHPPKSFTLKNGFFLDGRQNFHYDTADYANEKLLLMGYKIPTYKEGQFTLGFRGLSYPRIWSLYQNKDYIKESLFNTSHYKAMNGVLLYSFYSLTKFEELFFKIFKEQPKYLCGFKSNEILDLFNKNDRINDEQRKEPLFYFSNVDKICDRLLREI